MARWGLVIDLDRCTGCQACVIACKHENNVPFSSPTAVAEDQHTTWIRLAEADLSGRSTPLPFMCQHCDQAPCIRACPTSATYRTPDGIIAQIYSRCIGCRYCMNACPYGAKIYNWTTPDWPEATAAMANPDVSRRPKGIVEKCTFCHHRLIAARERAAAAGRDLAPGDYVPACVATCPSEAMVFGDLDDPESEVAALVGGPLAFRLREEHGTRPKVIYLRERQSPRRSIRETDERAETPNPPRNL